MATLSAIPNEILLKVSLYLDYPGLNAFSQVSHHIYTLANWVLYKTIAKRSPGKAMAWVAEKGKDLSARKLLQMCGCEILDDLVSADREPILIASSHGHAHLVELFLPHCIRHDSENEGGLFRRALTEAIQEEHIAVVQVFLKQRAHFITNGQDKHAAVPLCRAVEMGHVSIVRLLIEHNYCNLNTCDMDGMTPLTLAAKAKPSSTNLEIAKLLLEAGANLHIDPKLLLRAAKSDNFAVMKLFIENNLNWRQLEWFDILCEFSRPRRENHGIGLLLLSWINVDRIMNNSNIHRCLLLRAAIINRLDNLLKRILDEGPVLDKDHTSSRRAMSFCPLSVAVCYGRLSAVQLLLKHGADPNGDIGISPVQLALERNKHAMARLLFEKGASLDPEGCRGSPGYRQLLKLRLARVQGWSGDKFR